MTSPTRHRPRKVGQDRDAELFEQVASRADLLLDDLAQGRPAEPALRPLLGFLREVVLVRICQRESMVISAVALRGTDPEIERLRHEHLLLREDIEDLAAALTRPEPDSNCLVEVTRRLVQRLHEHLCAEADVLVPAPPDEPPDPSGWADAMRWYPLTEGPVIDVDQLIDADVPRALATRLAALRPGELLELRGHSDLHLLHQQVLGRRTDSFAWEERAAEAERAQGWRVFVRRRQE